MKINRDRLIQIIREELSPEQEALSMHAQIQKQIDELKQAIMKLRLVSQGEQTIETSVPHSADTEAERYSYQQYKEVKK